MHLRLPAVLVSTAVLGSIAWAGFTNPFVPAFRGMPGAQYGAWESFTIPEGGVNLPDDPNSTALNASLEQLVPGAFITGGGNLYQPAGAPQFRIVDSGPGDLREVVLQVSTWGSELVYTSPVLRYVDGQGQPQNLAFASHVELARYPSMGVNVESMFTWNLDSIADAVSSYSIAFEAAGPHMSLDAVTLDTRWNGGGGTLTSYCHPGLAGIIACPCGNPPSAIGRGCNNFGAQSGGAVLAGAGTAMLSSDTFVLTASGENTTALTIFVQSVAQSSTGLAFGAGVRCAIGSLKRLYSGVASGGVIVRPAPGDPSVSARSAALGAPILPGETRYYLAYYRDNNAVGPCGTPSRNFNATQGGRATWTQ